MTSPRSRPLPRGPWVAILAFLALIVPALTGADFRARVIAVTDGDTVTVLRTHGGGAAPERIRVRLDAIDAPERRQAWGRQAKAALSRLVFHRTVDIDSVDTDRYGRMVARLRAEGRDVSLDMVKSGMAWHFTRYSNDPDLARAEREARLARRGLWHDRDAMPPWEFRHRGGSESRRVTGDGRAEQAPASRR